VFFLSVEYQWQECMEQISHENYNTGDRDTMSHHNGRLEAMRASSVVIGENRYLPETETVLWRSVQKQKAAGDLAGPRKNYWN
jgi:hypothetical protein